MVYLPPPQLANAAQPSYADAYSKILAKYRSSPLTSASSIIILVASDVDALCAARMLSDLFNQDDVIHRLIPISGFIELENVRDELITYSELHTLVLLNIGSMLELSSQEWFGECSTLTVHVIDSLRPQHLDSLFMGGEAGERLIIWDDGGVEKLQEVHKAWEALQFEPEVNSDDEGVESDEDENEEPQTDEENEDDYEDGGRISGKRRSLGDGDSNPKRRRIEKDPNRLTNEERDQYHNRMRKHYFSGTFHGQSAAATIYILATSLERVDNDLLWFAILGLTYQYTASRISREAYETYHSIYYDEVSRLNPPPPNGGTSSLISLNPDDTSVRATDELRFMLFRHWTLYDAMYHSSYVASKLGIWKEKGRKRLTGLLAKMGFSIPQTQQPYPHMDMDLKRTLLHKLNDVAPEYGLIELSYPSFMRCYGYRSQPLSAADAVEGIGALLDVAAGIRMEVEVEGSRNGGEWFGGGRVWEANTGRDGTLRRSGVDGENGQPTGDESRQNGDSADVEEDAEKAKRERETSWWVKNFWTAFDALDNIGQLREALNLSMSLHRAIIRQGTSIIDKQDIRTMRNHRVVVLSQGPDLALFSHPSVLARLALWLVDALRDRVPATHIHSSRNKRKSLPFVVACLNEAKNTYAVVGVMAALDFGDVRRNEFSLSFLHSKEACNAVTTYTSFDASVLEISQKDLKLFLERLTEADYAS